VVFQPRHDILLYVLLPLGWIARSVPERLFDRLVAGVGMGVGPDAVQDIETVR